MSYTVEKGLDEINIAELLEDEVLRKMGASLVASVEADDRSRAEWLESQDQWLKLASQIKETKTTPWQGASNVKYPLMTVACTQFHARALPSLINSAEPVMAKVVGEDPEGQKLARAVRVRKYMSYQVMEEMEEWMDEMDRMLFVLPIIGLAYKKTYFSETLGRARSVLLLPKEVILNYDAKDYIRSRLTHVMAMDDNEIFEYQASGLFLHEDLGEPVEQTHNPNQTRDDTLGLSNSEMSEDSPHTLYEVHGWWDIDDDGYKEPYVITIHAASQKVLRIVARYDEMGIMRNERGELYKIEPLSYFTPYKFIPDPNSAVYALGFGTLLGPTNEAANSLINQLVDAGTLSNMQSGFLARGMKMKGGATRFRPGEWKIVNATGADLKNSVFPMPVRDPSTTLFNLLSFLIESGERISSVSDIMLGENPGQNQPATTSMAVLEQGLKVFTGIYRRIFRQLKAEYKKLYYINSLYLDEEKYQRVLDEQVEEEMRAIEGEATEEEAMMVREELKAQNANSGMDDFNMEDMDVLPSADPNMVTEAQKITKSNSLMEKLSMGMPLNVQEVLRRALVAEQHEDIDDLMNMPEPQPSIEEKEFELKTIVEMRATTDSYFDNLLKTAQAEGIEVGNNLQEYKNEVDGIIKTIELERNANAGAQGAGGQGSPTGAA